MNKLSSSLSLATRLLICSGSLLAPTVFADTDNLSEEFFKRVKLKGWMSQGMQAIEADDGAFFEEDSNMSPGFNRFRYALGFDVTLADNVTAYVEFSEEPNDFGVDYTPHIDFAVVNFALNDTLTYQIGTVGTGMFTYRGYSDGADVQSNPLIGNSPADMAGAAEGMKMFGDHGQLKWDFTISSSDFGESFGGDRGLTYIGKASFDFSDQFGLGASFSSSNHGDQVRNGASNIVRAGFYTGDGDNYRFPSSGTDSIRNTHMGLIPGLDTQGFLVDGQFKTESESLILRSWIGQLTDDFSFADAGGNRTVAVQSVGFIEEESEVSFYGLEGTFYFNEKTYVAARYTAVTNESEGVEDEDLLSRVQLGVGYFYRDNILFKGEFVNQVEEENSAGQIGSDWGGFMLETSFIF
ncbi:hypothetical protein TDB9533_01964 [Thalassocella blandensis]|nr:hypothetical protein TDB9533_01964 [Thalassocella blandensis]